MKINNQAKINSKQYFQGTINWQSLGKVGGELLSDSIPNETKILKKEIDTFANQKLPDDYHITFNPLNNLKDYTTFITSVQTGNEKYGNKRVSTFYDSWFLQQKRSLNELLQQIKISIQNEISVKDFQENILNSTRYYN